MTARDLDAKGRMKSVVEDDRQSIHDPDAACQHTVS
jgi:hypothetical protein